MCFTGRGHAGNPRTGIKTQAAENGGAAGTTTGTAIESGEPPAPDANADRRRNTEGDTIRRSGLDGYRRLFMQTPKITDRQPVFVSREVRDKIDGIVRLFGERKMSVSGFLENLARHHLDIHETDIEGWRKL